MINAKTFLSTLVVIGSLAGASVSSAQFPGNDRGRIDDRRDDRGRDDRGRDDRGRDDRGRDDRGRDDRGRDDRGRDDRGRDDRGGSSRTVTVYRLSDGKDFMMSLDRREAGHLGYRQQTSIQLFADASASRAPLYRCLVRGQGHFASSDANCEGQTPEGLLGHVERRATREASQELLRCYNKRAGRHLITSNYSECRGDFRTEGTLGFIPR